MAGKICRVSLEASHRKGTPRTACKIAQGASFALREPVVGSVVYFPIWVNETASPIDFPQRNQYQILIRIQ
ncbi:hypothetical protein KIN20_017693 [Parelaphostrongylus tenuis]|uniref:Uncharacterized protein n=1 Tax=Parelaphostrongylus tenuis TaxID=148309 RepID=A0AAD5QNT2_PARTN|nr:hypothetical protein KIN20_017693 [Parelaphostrongylus tenuis]